MSKLPKGWVECKLADICNIEYGKDISTKEITNDKKYPVFGANSIIGYYDEYLYEEEKVLISCRGANSGRINLSPPKVFVTHNSLVLNFIYPLEKNKRFFSYALQSTNNSEYVTGSAQPQVTIKNANEIPIKLAPLNEQKRIVEKLDKLLSRVEEAKARLEKIPVILKRFRQSVLNAAVTGELTKDWREKNGIDEEWEEKSLRELCLKFTYGSSKKSDSKGKVPVLRMGNIQEGKIVWEDLKYSSDSDEIIKYSLKKGDVLFNRTNSPELVGKTAIYRGERPAIYAGYLIKVTTGENLDPEFLNLCLNSIQAQEWCMQVKTDGVSQSNINAQKLADFIILTPSVEEQTEIVRRVESLFKKADEIEERYKKAKDYVDKLTQSILAKAFRGELVPQDPNDEPASVLLERIKLEKEKLNKDKKQKKRAAGR